MLRVILFLLLKIVEEGLSVYIPRPFAPDVIRRQGVYIEKWNGIDTFELKKLTDNSRFPYHPTWRGYADSFHQIENWGENFGTRIRSYFVPAQNGMYQFFIASNGGSQLFLSRDSNPAHKSKIASVSDRRYTGRREYDKYEEQKAYPVYLEKGKYYYIETLMKEFYGGDHLSVAVKIPSGQFIAPISKKYLWTAVYSYSSQYNSTLQKMLLKIVARAGARAGKYAGADYGSRAGAEAGARAGAKAGKITGAEAGAKAAEATTRETVTKGLNEVLMNYYRSRHIVHVFFFSSDGRIISTNIAKVPNGNIPGGISSVIDPKLNGSSVDPSGSGNSVTSVGSSTSGAVDPSSSGAAATNASGSSSSSSSSKAMSKAAATLESTTDVVPIGVDHLNLGGSSISGEAGNITRKISKEEQIYSYNVKPGENVDDMARKLVYADGPASKLVYNAFYRIHSLNWPALQENKSMNLCFKSMQSRISLQGLCHYFIVRKGKNLNKGDTRSAIMFESACMPNYFIAQKNFRYVLRLNDNSYSFRKSALLYPYKSTTYPSAFNLLTTHDFWFVCESSTHRGVRGTAVVLRFPSKGDDYLDFCTFAIVPMPKGADVKANCKGVLETPHIGIPGNKQRPDKKPVKKKSQSTKCIALNFINNANIPFKITSSLKRQEYLVTEDNLRLKAIIKRPELHRHVVFRAKDPTKKFTMYIEGDRSIIVTPSSNCVKYIPVTVTAVPVPPTPTPQKPTTAKPPVHYHYHYHNASQAPCPTACQVPQPCPATCPQTCCQHKPTAQQAQVLPAATVYQAAGQPAPCSPACLSNSACLNTCPQHCCYQDDVINVVAKSTITKEITGNCERKCRNIPFTRRRTCQMKCKREKS